MFARCVFVCLCSNVFLVSMYGVFLCVLGLGMILCVFIVRLCFMCFCAVCVSVRVCLCCLCALCKCGLCL